MVNVDLLRLSSYDTVLDHIGRTIQKRVFGHLRTANAQISQRARAVWSGPSLPAGRITGDYRMYKWRARPGWYFAHAQDDLNLDISRMYEGSFAHDGTHIILFMHHPIVCKHGHFYYIFIRNDPENDLVPKVITAKIVQYELFFINNNPKLYTLGKHASLPTTTVEPRWLEHLWHHGIFFLDMNSSYHWGLIIAPG